MLSCLETLSSTTLQFNGSNKTRGSCYAYLSNYFPNNANNCLYYDAVGEFDGVGPALPRGRDKSGPYALAIASLGLSSAIRQQ